MTPFLRFVPMLATVALAMIGCDAMMRITIREESTRPVLAVRGSEWPSPCTLHTLEVVALDGGATVWRIVSSGNRVRAINYPTVPAGFTEEVPPQTLRVGAEYEVRITGGSSCALAVPARFLVTAAAVGA